MSALLTAAALAAAASDTPQDYSHVIPLEISGRQSVVQLQLPRDVYLQAHSPTLNDVRVFDAHGKPQVFALRVAEGEVKSSHATLQTRVFPLMAETPESDLGGLEISTGSDGRLISVRLPLGREARPRQQLAALVLDLRQDGGSSMPLIDALRFQIPAGRSTYTGQVWLEASDDLKTWATVCVADLSWLSNTSNETLASDRMEFAPRSMRYARLRWRSGEPLEFASITAESPANSYAPPAAETLLLPAQPGMVATDLQYLKPAAIPVIRFGLQLESVNTVLPATLGSYYRLQSRRQNQRDDRRIAFEPVLRTTFYRLERDGKPYTSGDIPAPMMTDGRWVLRFEQPPPVQPPLRISWQPATLVFVAGGAPPYTLAVGRDGVENAARRIDEVAPGYSEADLRSLERARPEAVQMQTAAVQEAAKRISDNASGEQRRLILLWSVLLAGVAVVAWMIWRLTCQQSNIES